MKYKFIFLYSFKIIKNSLLIMNKYYSLNKLK